MVLGHETSAIITKLGPGVDNFKIGDRVHLHPGPACHVCECCIEGNEHNCQVIKLGKAFHGSIRRVCNHPAEYTIRMPENLTMEEGALIEPWTVGVYAVERSRITVGQKCVIIGAGAVGVMVFLAARLAGAVDICVVDISKPKLELISKVGDCKTILASRDCKETARSIEECLGGKPDVAFDASCTAPGITTAIYAAKPCGKVVLAGLAPETCTLPMQHAAINEIDILNVLRYGTCYPRAMEVLRAGKINLKSLIAKKFPLEKTGEAIQAMASGLTQGFKVLVDCTQ
ncbi:hypothetical protein EB796_003128 [Bugula neritina]|uniref:SORD n=1 Tax=Bugula neritina TaxID=10212 RepID=A0A7J7KLL6_BUGNE|nr:hypothetical protein EB796_003128 [Bugula neritina]